MKKLLLTLAIAALTFTACSNDDNSGNTPTSQGVTITASSVIDASSGIKTVKAVNTYDMVIATGTFKNGGFSITLPATPSETLLNPMYSTAINGLSISNYQTMGIAINFEGYNTGDSFIGDLRPFIEDTNTLIVYIYVDRSLKVTGNYTDEGINHFYSMTLSKGYNKVAVSYDYSTETVTYSYVCPAPTETNEWIFLAD